jgi:hypothetical protein
MKKLILLMVLLFACVSFGADGTFYVTPTAGDDGKDGLTEANAWATLGHAIDNHTSVSGDTVTIYIKKDTTVTDTIVTFDDTGSKQEGINFIFRTETAGDKFDLGSAGAGADYFAMSGVTSGSITLQDCEMEDANTRFLFRAANGNGMDVIIRDCDFTLTAANAQVYSSGTVGGARDLTIIGTTAVTTSVGIIVNVGDAIIISDSTFTAAADKYILRLETSADSISIDSSTLTSTGDAAVITIDGDITTMSIESSTLVADGDKYVIEFLDGDIGSISIADSTLTTTGSEGGFYTHSSGTTLVSLEMINVIVNAVGVGVNVTTSDGILIQNCSVTATTGSSAVAIGTSDVNARILNNTLVATGVSARGLLLGDGVNSYKVLYNTINGVSHALFVRGGADDTGNEIAYNIIVSSGSVGAGCFGSGCKIYNNTIYATSGTSLITGAAGGTAPAVPASKNLEIYNNICVALDGLAYYDYDDSTGIDGGGRGSNSDDMNDQQDNNLYWRVSNFSTGVVELGENGSEQVCDTMDEVRTAWKTATSGGGLWNTNYGNSNDTNSIIADPMFVDAANGDFHLGSNSPCLGIGRYNEEFPLGRARYNYFGRRR